MAKFHLISKSCRNFGYYRDPFVDPGILYPKLAKNPWISYTSQVIILYTAMEKPLLQAIVRDVASKTASSVRSEGEVPAVLYGNNIANIHLTVKLGEFEKLFRKAGESTIVELKTVDGQTHNVLIQDVQRHYLTGAPIHIDFLEVSMTEKLTATVPLEFVGESIAVKNMGGTLVKVLDEVEVECLPGDLPHSIEVDISGMSTFDSEILIKDLKVAAGVQINAEPEETVANIQPPRDVEAELAGPVVEDISAVEGAAEDKPATEGEAETKDKE